MLVYVLKLKIEIIRNVFVYYMGIITKHSYRNEGSVVWQSIWS